MRASAAPSLRQPRGTGLRCTQPDAQFFDMVTSTPNGVSRWAATTTGVVFCGGKSSRMGVDKALLVDSEGRTMLARACRTLGQVAGEVWLACGPISRYAELGLPLILDQRIDGGPLAGLEAALDRASTRWLAVLACDMPRVSPTQLAELLLCAEESDLDACWLETAAGAEPLCAVYSRSCLAPVRAALDAGERRMISFHSYPVAGRALRVAGLEQAESDLTQNLNTPADWDNFQKRTR